MIANPLDEQELEWISTDGKQSGKTTLGVRMKKFEKTIEAEEKEFERHFDEWTSVQAELRHLASLIVGPDGLESLLAGNFDPESVVDAERIEMVEEIKAEQEAFMEQIEKIGLAVLEAMTESEKASGSWLTLWFFHMLITPPLQSAAGSQAEKGRGVFPGHSQGRRLLKLANANCEGVLRSLDSAQSKATFTLFLKPQCYAVD